MTWRSGETALVRYAWQGRTHFGGPAIVVEDDGRRTALYTPMGTPAVRSTMDYATGALGEPRLESWHTTHNLRFLEAGLGYCISAMYEGASRKFLCWYIDMIEPIRRTRDGFVLWDLALDIVVAPNLSWKMKDEDQFTRLPEIGWITPERAAQMRHDVRNAIERIEKRQPPFNEDWPNWRADPSWPIPKMPDNWAEVPP
ncbi:MAG TPA: DUF402 domain-containing protein [Rhizomicrobium sp.]|jgi:hypothetical protein|nr:DUF402 domain-containing protein [Rhizomicrobium sp.]